MKYVILPGVLLLMVMMLTMVSAQTTRLNITMVETVDQNITYAENFDLIAVQKYCLISGVVNITNPSLQTVADINLSFTNTDNMVGNFTLGSGRDGSQVIGTSPGSTYILHISELQAGDYSAFNYYVNCSSVDPPLSIDTTYTNVETGINRKVLAGKNWTVQQNASNQLAIGVPINNINITITAQTVTWNVTGEPFRLAGLAALGDFANVHGNGTNPLTWWWQVNSGTLIASAWEYIKYNVTAPNNVPTSNTYLAVLETLEYQISYLASNLSLQEVTAIADIEFNVQKQIIKPADNDNNNNVTWQVDADITVPFNISYNLTEVSMWVTTTLDLGDTDIPVFGPINTTQMPLQEINQTTSWSAVSWTFNYTDASDDVNARPPIVWFRPYFNIMNAYNQIVNSTITQNGNDLYMKYIYVINGYWLQIDKNITNVAQDQYRIDTLVQNIGNAWTPTGLVVTVYDFVPIEFGPWNWSVGADSNAAVTGSGFNGTSYRWTVPLKSPLNSSLGPATESLANRTWTVTYFVNGSGDYRVSELYIVGLDPRKVDGAGTHEGITVISAFANASVEAIYILVVVFLVIINVINFVMTRRINQKLNK